MSGDERIVFRDVRDFIPTQTFACGQAFRWNRERDGSYTGIAGGRAANIAFTPASPEASAGDIVIRPLGGAVCAHSDAHSDTPADAGASGAPRVAGYKSYFWENYLDLKRDYGEIKRTLTAGDAVMADAVAHGAGIRILKQEPWETLISFIISQNNHIPRIKACIERLCEGFGTRIDCGDGGARFAFPSVNALASLSEMDLAPCGLGYRARYIAETARQVAETGGAAWLEGLRGAAGNGGAAAEEAAADGKAAEKALLSLCGVGPKVAACVLLFGLGRTEGFPVDVWMERVMRERYGIAGKQAAADYAAARFGPYAGIAQQYLFYSARNGRRAFE
jgi:N-glycosylase/DNA lyase